MSASPRRWPFALAVGVGWAGIGYGLASLWGDGGIRRIIDVGIWLTGLALVHDLVVAPLALLGAAGVMALAPRVARAPLLAASAASAVVLAVAWPLLGGYGRIRDNPSVLPLDYGPATATVLGVVWALALGWIVVRVLRTRRVGSGAALPATADRGADCGP